jgi:hypothetical protein
VPDDGAFRTMASGPDRAPVLVVFEADGAVRTWAWQDSSPAAGDWRPVAGATAPPWRDDPGLVTDRASHRLLLFGGIPERGGARAGDTWAWDGASWSELRPAHRPAGGPAAVADLPTGPLVYEQDGTWAWDGADWTLAQSPGRPRWQPYAALAAVPGPAVGGTLAILLTGPAGSPGQTWRWTAKGWLII